MRVPSAVLGCAHYIRGTVSAKRTTQHHRVRAKETPTETHQTKTHPTFTRPLIHTCSRAITFKALSLGLLFPLSLHLSFPIMWKAAMLTFGLLVALVGMVQAAEGHANSIYGVKLCGREFIRAVIFTCGGSRWRRGVGDAGDISIDEETEAYSPWSSNATPGLVSKQRPGLEAQGWSGEVREGGSAAAVFSRLARSPISEEVLEALRSADRKGRDVVVGLSNACCKWGCSKSEISSLC